MGIIITAPYKVNKKRLNYICVIDKERKQQYNMVETIVSL